MGAILHRYPSNAVTMYFCDTITFLFLLLTVLLFTGAETPMELKLFTSPLSWNDARAHCEKVNMTLVTLDPEVNQHLHEIQQYPSYVAAVPDNFWIGLFDWNEVDVTTSPDGYAWSATCESQQATGGGWAAWDDGQPDDTSSKLCVVMDKDINVWKTEQCSNERPFMCAAPLDGCSFTMVNYSRCSFQNLTTSYAPLSPPSYDECAQFCEDDVRTLSRCQVFAAKTAQGGEVRCAFFRNDNTETRFCYEDAYQTNTSYMYRRVCYAFSINETVLTGSAANSDVPNACLAETTTSSSTTTTTTAASTTTTTTSTTTATTTPTTPATTSTTTATTTPTTPVTTSTTAATMVFSTITTEPVTTPEARTTPTAQDASQTATAEATSQTTVSVNDLSSPSTDSQDTTENNYNGKSTHLSWVVGGGNQHLTSSTQMPTGSLKSRRRYCACAFRGNSSLDESAAEKASQASEEINKELRVDVKSLSSRRRQKESAKDERHSSANMGLVSIVFLSIVLGVIVLFDFATICQWLRNVIRRRANNM